MQAYENNPHINNVKLGRMIKMYKKVYKLNLIKITMRYETFHDKIHFTNWSLKIRNTVYKHVKVIVGNTYIFKRN